jgi:GT2 family glycosyltransferase
MTKICVTVLSYNGQNELEDCIHSLLRQTVNDFEMEIHVLDNDSKDGSWQILEGLAAKYKRVKIFKSQKNTGFTGGHNFLITQAKDNFDYFLLFNQDAQAGHDLMLSNLLQASKSLNDQALIQPAIINHSGEVAGTGSTITYFGLGVPTIEFYENSQADLFEVDLTQFAAVLIPKGIIQKVGLLSQIYFAYHEDVDYSIRARLLGFSNYASKTATIIHDQKPGKFKTKKFGMYLAERNRYYYLLSHFSWLVLGVILPILILQEISMWYFFWSNGNLAGKIRANREVFSGFRKVMNYRRENRNLMQQSEFVGEFYQLHRGAFDARKLLEDPGISSLSKVMVRSLNLVFNLYRPVYLVASKVWP